MRDRLDFLLYQKSYWITEKSEQYHRQNTISACFNPTGCRKPASDRFSVYAFHQTDILLAVPEDPEISKIISGQRNVAKDIIYLYQTLSGSAELKKALDCIFDELSDADYVKEQIYHILWNDISISQGKKQELSVHYVDTVAFMSDCLLFALSRNFIPKSKKTIVSTLFMSEAILTFPVSRHRLNNSVFYHFP